MATLELHPDTRKQIQQLSDNLPQGILLKGSSGVGLCTIARSIAGSQLANIIAPTDKDGKPTNDGSGEIRIAQIRELAAQIRGKSTTKRIIIIDDADRMNSAAQNAFLKLLEEPTQHTHFILTSHHAEQLLPTVVSRVQPSIVRDISKEQSLLFIKRLGETDARRTQQLLFLASGKPAEILRLYQSSEYFSQSAKAVEDARSFLGGQLPDRVKVVQSYHNDRPGALRMLEQAIRILDTTLRNKPTSTTIYSASQLVDIYARLQQNGNVRLQLLSFVVQ